jgi:hypothetical protein
MVEARQKSQPWCECDDFGSVIVRYIDADDDEIDSFVSMTAKLELTSSAVSVKEGCATRSQGLPSELRRPRILMGEV